MWWDPEDYTIRLVLFIIGGWSFIASLHLHAWFLGMMVHPDGAVLITFGPFSIDAYALDEQEQEYLNGDGE